MWPWHGGFLHRSSTLSKRFWNLKTDDKRLIFHVLPHTSVMVSVHCMRVLVMCRKAESLRPANTFCAACLSETAAALCPCAVASSAHGLISQSLREGEISSLPVPMPNRTAFSEGKAWPFTKPGRSKWPRQCRLRRIRIKREEPGQTKGGLLTMFGKLACGWGFCGCAVINPNQPQRWFPHCQSISRVLLSSVGGASP